MYTNTGAMVALQTLRQINSALDTTSDRVASGVRIGEARDGAVSWAAATTLRSDNGALGVVRDALSLGRATVGAAAGGLAGVREGLEEVRNLLVSARTPGADRTAIQTEVEGILADVEGIARSATINEQNLLSVDSSAAGFNQTASVVGGFERTATGVSISTIDLDVNDIKVLDPAGGTAEGILDEDRTAGSTSVAVNAIDIGALTDSAADMTTLEETIQIADAAIQDLIVAESRVGSALSRIDSQSDFVAALIDANDRAVGTLVDADMEAESSRLRALQTQQQLAIQALAVSNASMANVLGLFR